MLRLFIALALCISISTAVQIAPLLYADSPSAIPGSYIVILNDGLNVNDRDTHIQELRNNITNLQSDSEITFVYTSILGFAARLANEMLKIQLSHPSVKYVEVDQRFTANAITQTGATWGLQRISQRTLPLTGNYIYNDTQGAGVHVYVLDTGIYIEHEDFGGRATSDFDATTEGLNDANGHGTHCAGTIGGTKYGVAKNVNLHSVKVLNSKASGTSGTLVAGIDYISANFTAPAIASASLGGSISTAVDDAVRALVAKGVPFVVAAGNNNNRACSYSPARVEVAITVGATTVSDSRASYSNYGTCVTLFAPGSNVVSDWIGSPNAFKSDSGTSMAAPHVTGVLALHQSSSLSPLSPLSPLSLKTWLVQTATGGLLPNPGIGSTNILLFSPYA